MAKKKEGTELVEIKPLNRQHITITLIGDSPLICHKWSEKAKKEMLDKQMKKAKKAKTAKDPEQDYRESLYWLDDEGNMLNLTPNTDPAKWKGNFGFPAIGIKAAFVSACRNIDGIPMTLARGALHINREYIVIDGKPSMREDMVRLNGGTADIRYRGEFKKWKSKIDLIFNADVLSTEQIVNLFSVAGFAVGIGEWRPEKNGTFGLFHIE